LREQIGYNGLVMTDDLTMKGITKNRSLGKAAVMAILAGADQVLVCGNEAQMQEVHKALWQAVQKGTITEDRLELSINRINHALCKVFSWPYSNCTEEEILSKLQLSIAEGNKQSLEASIAGITQLRGQLPKLSPESWTVVAPEHPRYSMELATLLSSELPHVQITEKRYKLDPSDEDCRDIAKDCNQNCIYITFRALLNKGQAKLGQLLSQNCKQRIVVFADSPFDIKVMPHWDNCLATFDPSPLAFKALSLVLSGKASAKGTCPVDL
jgi:beta-N-acetylhexosaminidase